MSNYQTNELHRRFLLNNGILPHETLNAIWEQMGTHDQLFLTKLLNDGWINNVQAQDIRNKVEIYQQHFAKANPTDRALQQDALSTARVHNEQAPSALNQILKNSQVDNEPTLNLHTDQIKTGLRPSSDSTPPLNPNWQFPSGSQSDRSEIQQTIKRDTPRILADDSESAVTASNNKLQDWLDAKNSAGKKTVGPYTILDELGRGGMSVVYKACISIDSEEIALKVLTRKGVLKSGGTERFEREAAALRRLRHPNIIRVYDAIFTKDLSYIAMEQLHGGSLEQRLRRTGPIPIREAVQICEKVAWALQHAHEQNIIHRDLKPANILLTSQSQPVVADFGVAKVRNISQFSGLSKHGQILGTPGYMSPEQADGRQEEIDARCDVYSLGATLYALLIGEAPFTGSTVAKVLTAVLSEQPKALSKQRKDIPPELETVVMRCMEKNPDGRFDGAGELAQVLGDWLENNDGDSTLDRVPSSAFKRPSGTKKISVMERGLFIMICVILASLLFSSESRRDNWLSTTAPTPNKGGLDSEQGNRLKAAQINQLKLNRFQDRLENSSFLLNDNYREMTLKIGLGRVRDSTMERVRKNFECFDKWLQEYPLSKKELVQLINLVLQLIECELDLLNIDSKVLEHSVKSFEFAKKVLQKLKDQNADDLAMRTFEARIALQAGLKAHFCFDLVTAREFYSLALKNSAKDQPDEKAFILLCIGQSFFQTKNFPEARTRLSSALKVMGSVETPKSITGPDDKRLVRALLQAEINEQLSKALSALGTAEDKAAQAMQVSYRGRFDLTALKTSKVRLALSFTHLARAEQFKSNRPKDIEREYKKAEESVQLLARTQEHHSVPSFFLAMTLCRFGEYLMNAGQGHRALVKFESARAICQSLKDVDPNNLAYLMESAIIDFSIGMCHKSLKMSDFQAQQDHRRNETDSLEKCRVTINVLKGCLPATLMPDEDLETAIQLLKRYREAPLIRRATGYLR
jgi:serine/threonine protein kinase